MCGDVAKWVVSPHTAAPLSPSPILLECGGGQGAGGVEEKGNL